MSRDYLHNHAEFAELIRIVARDMDGIDPGLVEKDYWIMQCLFGLQQQGFDFELKGGTSLSKGFRIIDRFSEDIDIRINPPAGRDVKTGSNQTKPAHVRGRAQFYDWLAGTIKIDGIVDVSRDRDFDNTTMLSGGIRLHYNYIGKPVPGLKDGVLLEAGFDTVTPNSPVDVSSWAYNYAVTKVELIDNRAKSVRCYDPGYTFVEKLQTISTKFRREQETGEFPVNFLRHYYDVYRLLLQPTVRAFIGTAAYNNHKAKRFRRADEPDLTKNEAFLLSDATLRRRYAEAYNRPNALYYSDRPSLDEILEEIAKWRALL